jgi:small subunit ribosomal protein S21
LSGSWRKQLGRQKRINDLETHPVSPGPTVEGRPLEVIVDDRGVERAIRALKRIVATEGVVKAAKRRRSYEKPSIRKRRKRREAERRRRRAARRLARAGR